MVNEERRGEGEHQVHLDEQHDDRRRLVKIFVNEQPVEVEGPRQTGLAIKEAAIKQGVKIQLDFVLSVEVSPGHSKIVGDKDVVVVHPGQKFHAIAPDDNS